jgi:hypothetical protein
VIQDSTSHEDSSIVLLELDETCPSRGTPSGHAEKDPETISTGLYYKYPNIAEQHIPPRAALAVRPQGFPRGHSPLVGSHFPFEGSTS